MMRHRTAAAVFVSFFLVLFWQPPARAAVVEYNLTLARQEVHITGKPAQGMTVNGGIPDPTLTFTEGDMARIHVHNTIGRGNLRIRLRRRPPDPVLSGDLYRP